MLEQCIKERLLSIPALTALVGPRIYTPVLPQNQKLQSVRYHVQGAERPQQLRGPGAFVMTPVQVDSYVGVLQVPNALDTCLAIAAAVLGNGRGDSATGLFGWIGELTGGSPATIEVRAVECLNDGDTTWESDEINRIRVRQLYRVHWRLAS